MGKRGRTVGNIVNSDDTADLDAVTVSHFYLSLASHAARAGKETAAPPWMFKIPPDDNDNPLAMFVWRVALRHLGLWLSRGVSKALLDPTIKCDAEMRFRFGVALELGSEKDRPVAARDAFLVLGFLPRAERRASIAGSEPKNTSVPMAVRYASYWAADYLEESEVAISASAIAKVWEEYRRGSGHLNAIIST